MCFNSQGVSSERQFLGQSFAAVDFCALFILKVTSKELVIGDGQFAHTSCQTLILQLVLQLALLLALVVKIVRRWVRLRSLFKIPQIFQVDLFREVLKAPGRIAFISLYNLAYPDRDPV